jgi:hypothetical protein
VKLAILAIHYPGVKIDPKNIGVEINSMPKVGSSSSSKPRKKSSFGIRTLIFSSF